MRYRTHSPLASFFHVTEIIRRVILSLIFWGIIIGIIIAIFAGSGGGRSDGDVLVLRPRGTLVDTYTLPKTYQGIPMSSYLDETLLRDMVSALDTAAADEQIRGLWLDLSELRSAGPAAAAEMGDAVARFSASGKHVVASAFSYNTSLYRIACPADAILVDRLGEVFPSGYGSWRMYFGAGLERLGADVRLFRSGESKTGGENMTRDSISEAALRDEKRLLGSLWDRWLEDVSRFRGLDKDDFVQWIDQYDKYLLEAEGNASLSARKAGLVDAVETGTVLDRTLTEVFGAGYALTEGEDYLLAHTRKLAGDTPKIAVVPISGTLIDGEGAGGQAGSLDVVNAVKEAREARGVRAVVLRINSPGGAVSASEDIRRAVAETRRNWNLPVVVSMGNLAASGGYWIAMESDWIICRPETITGSIGVYSLGITFERALWERLGIRVDGWATTPWSGAGNPGRTMNERTASLYKAGIMDIDALFRQMVEEKRGLDKAEVKKLAGGIPWSGSHALMKGLADQPGGLNTAGEKAAELAGLDPEMDEWEFLYFDKALTWKEELMAGLLWESTRREHKKGLFRFLDSRPF